MGKWHNEQFDDVSSVETEWSEQEMDESDDSEQICWNNINIGHYSQSQPILPTPSPRSICSNVQASTNYTQSAALYNYNQPVHVAAIHQSSTIRTRQKLKISKSTKSAPSR